ncbi:helix-turn-helix transcriptional regulator [Conexibacter stalactiti]|uniref:Helix-turn-helix transcriptional regulator n=1 Tax=Conexibacter stalactiti TaxID=1940611 RepID=A0ABU4HSF8_9ACTN|nr:helix-turn-helix transcriptional regulator [Conexibacter stalactiti]MDW5596252.1 helix-turn-helix transcriptional regulator [Conexibacter stalactiti]MEC5036894.1 helix-turn-helix transcriptional regulator [Conexibacter stalactiti]
MAIDQDELAGSLRSWRDRVKPAEAGLPGGGRRRAPGLRRQEVAQLAGLSVDYLARLEQGRATNPSPSVLAPLARALRLSDDERAHLFRVAGQAEPAQGAIKRHITPSVQRVLDRLTDTPVMVIDASWQCVTSNPLAYALAGDTSALPLRERNVAWTVFTEGPTRWFRTEAEERLLRRELVSDLREARSRYPNDRLLAELVDDLMSASADFAELWEQRPDRQPNSGSMTFVHPEIGPVTLDCDFFTVRDSDLRVIVLTAAPGSEAAGQLDLLAAIGLQQFS